MSHAWCYNSDLYHSGVKGMHWGVRRYQNEDGSLTPEGEKRYNKKRQRLANKIQRLDKSRTKAKESGKRFNEKHAMLNDKKLNKQYRDYLRLTPENQQKHQNRKTMEKMKRLALRNNRRFVRYMVLDTKVGKNGRKFIEQYGKEDYKKYVGNIDWT